MNKAQEWFDGWAVMAAFMSADAGAAMNDALSTGKHHLVELLRHQTANLRTLEMQKVRHGMDPPIKLLNEIEFVEKERGDTIEKLELLQRAITIRKLKKIIEGGRG